MTALWLALGVGIGILSGMVGIGGGIILIPILIYCFGMSQHAAQGTSLAMMLGPVGIFAVYGYWREGNVDIRIAVLLALGFLVGGWFGGFWAQQVSGAILRKVFAVVLMFAAVKMFFK